MHALHLRRAASQLLRLASALVFVLGTGSDLPAVAQTAAPVAPDVVRVSLNPQTAAYLPIYWAADHGYFADQHLDVHVTKITGSSLAVLPMLARGDLDIMPIVVGPGFFNAAAQGFALKIVASIDQAQPGWHDTGCLLVRQELWTSGEIRKVADFKGKIVDGGVDGTPQNYLLKQAILKGGLTLAQMTYTERFKTVPDTYAAFRNKAVDVASGAEPTCTQIQTEGLAHKYLTFQDVVPGLQASFITTSAAYAKDHRDVIKRFLHAMVEAERDLKRSNGLWTPASIATMAKWSDIPPATIQLVPGPPYTGQFGSINVDSIMAQQQFWLTEGSVKQSVAATDLIDPTIIAEVRRDLGVK